MCVCVCVCVCVHAHAHMQRVCVYMQICVYEDRGWSDVEYTYGAVQ